ncbi:MAG: hypothetical protein E2O92_00205 [Alphaproteobacteria bacterium]|nr:MAG: hypothetical protein E2O92_00205 [Alphaproteobacteria bacterium]
MNTGNQTTSSDWLATRLQTMRAWGIPIIAMITPARALAGLANLKLARQRRSNSFMAMPSEFMGFSQISGLIENQFSLTSLPRIDLWQCH